MENSNEKNTKDQKQSNNSGKVQNSKKYDIFISYRYLSTTDKTTNPYHKHTTSLARSIVQAFRSEGFDVFFDCDDGFENASSAIDNSQYFIILFTEDSLKAIENFPYEKIKGMIEKKENGKEGEGYNYVSELYKIENHIDNKVIDKDKVFLLNIDGRAVVHRKDKDGKDIDISLNTILNENGYINLHALKRIAFPTNTDFSINNLINPTRKSDNRIRKKVQCFNKEIPWFRFSYGLCKKLSWCSAILIPLFCIALGCVLYQCFSKPIVFAGGGTVQKYIVKNYGIDLNWYQRWLGWKYIHLPSEEAWSLLWDDMTADGKNRRYWPVVLSSEILNINSDFKKRLGKNELVEYEVGTAPLMIQIIDGDSTDSLSLQEVFDKICDTSYKIHTTSERSGTYNAYKKLLQDEYKFNLDSCINERGRHDFTTEYYNTAGKKHIFLANELWYCKKIHNLIPIYDNKIAIHLYVYTISETVPETTTDRKISIQVKKFLRKIDCDTETPIQNTNEKKYTLEKKELINKGWYERLKQHLIFY